MKLNSHKTGLAVGLFAGTMHLLWVIFVAVGFAQTLVAFILSIHFLDNPYTVKSFDLVTALTLIVVTTGVGYVAGKLFALIWNNIQK